MEQMVVQLSLHPSVWNYSRYYLPDTKYPTRTNSSVIKGASDAGKDGNVVQGIKIGQSFSSIIVDLVDDVPIDCVLEGVRVSFRIFGEGWGQISILKIIERHHYFSQYVQVFCLACIFCGTEKIEE